MSKFLESAASRETSVELIEAIYFVAGKNESEAVRIWEDPTDVELLAVWERVTKNGLIAADEFCWGVDGSKWAVSFDAR